MLGKLKGIVDEIYTDHILLDILGIGFEVHLCQRDIASIKHGDTLALFIHTQIREQDISFYGFMYEVDKGIFNELIKVKGIGGKLAISILGQMSPSELVKALSNKDKNTIKQLSGVGPKLAERMIAELSGTKFNITFDPYQNDQATKSRSELLIQDATSALANLGYNKISAAETASCIYQNNNNVSLSELIRLALKELSK